MFSLSNFALRHARPAARPPAPILPSHRVPPPTDEGDIGLLPPPRFEGGPRLSSPDDLTPDEMAIPSAVMPAGAAPPVPYTTGPPDAGLYDVPPPAPITRGDVLPYSQARIAQDEAATADRHHRYMAALSRINEEEAMSPSPMEEAIKQAEQKRQWESLQPATPVDAAGRPLPNPSGPHVRFSQGGAMVDYLPSDQTPPEAPTVGDIRAKRAAEIKALSQPAYIKSQDRASQEAKARLETQRYEYDRQQYIEEQTAKGKEVDKTVLDDMEREYRYRLSTLGVRPPTPLKATPPSWNVK